MARLKVDGICARVGDWLAPPRCHVCRQPWAAPVCPGCEAALPWNVAACRLCATPLSSPGAQVCAACLKDPPPHARAWTAFRYEPPVARHVVGLKFGAQLASAWVLGELMARRLARRAEPLPELLIPVPLHVSRLRRRGYNQALEIGRVLSRKLAVELAPALARRVRSTPEQTALAARERRRNLHGAFEVSGAVRGRNLALLDDVITTGATVAELARAARAAGALQVEAWAVARA